MKKIPAFLKISVALFVLSLAAITAVSYGATFTKGPIGKQDMSWWTGTSARTFTRSTSEGYDLTLTKFDQYVDVAAAYGGNVNYTKATISSALTAVGAVNKVGFFLAPTTWTIDADVTITANVTLILPPGCTLSVSAGKTMTVQGPVAAGRYTVKSGTGTLAFTSNKAVQWVYPEWWGAAGDGTTDDTDEINYALATGKNVKLSSQTGYYVADALVFSSTAGQVLAGDAQLQTQILVDSSMDTTEDGVVELGANDQEIRDLKIVFDQVDTAARGSMTTYQDAIYAAGRTGTKIRNVRIEEAYDGIDLTGAVSGVLVDNLEMSCFNRGIQVNGATGDVKIVNSKIGNVGSLTANQLTVLGEDSTYGLYVTRADALIVSDTYFQVGTGIYFLSGGAADPSASLSNCNFMNENGILVAAGSIRISSCDFVVDGTGEQAVEITGGNVSINGCRFDINATLTDPVIDVTGGTLTMSGSTIDTAANDIKSVYGNGASVRIILSGNNFIKTTNTAYSVPCIDIESGTEIIASGNHVNTAGSGSGNFIALGGDDSHVIFGNHAPGYNIDLPTTPYLLQCMHNIVKIGSDFDQNYDVGGFIVKYFTGSLDGSGDATIAHGITNAHYKVFGVFVYEKGGSGEVALTGGTVTVDGTSINISGGSASTKYRAVIILNNSPDAW